MEQARIAELLAPFLNSSADESNAGDTNTGPTLNTQDLIPHISTYIDILLRWNSRINLTAIRDPEEIVTRHFGESLFAARHLLSRTPSATSALKVYRVADIGSGAGFPGLPIKLWAPHISLTLIESNHKKATFLKEITRSLTLTDVNIQNTRAETIAETIRVRYDLVTLRAVERFETILPTAAALVAPAGRLALLISSAQEPSTRTSLPNLQWLPPIPIPHSRARVLAVAQFESE